MPNMKRPPVKKLRDIPMEAESKAEYPYNLRLRLEKQELDKLNIDMDDYNIDDVARFDIKAKVISLSSNENYDGEDNKTIEFQITDLSIAKKDK